MTTSPPPPPVTTPTPKYPGAGFVVHEWGTDTIVVGSDGSLQRGLHHEEEGLPAFVYDRIKGAIDANGNPISAEVKMETPVTYFYSDKPLAVNAHVDFPKGVFTQWFPAVSRFLPLIAWKDSIITQTGGMLPTAPMDPVLDLTFPFQSATCRDTFTKVEKGQLDWGSIEVLPRGAATTLPDAPLDQYSWSHARAVDSNAVRTMGGQVEQFLFYRGLGNFDLPVKVTAAAGGHVTMANGYAEPMGAAFVLSVGAANGAFKAHPEGIGAGGSLADTAPALDGAPALADYTKALGDAVTTALDGAGLYHDESVAMVNTWKRQWFTTPGVRLLYLIPQSWTEASIPLTLDPKPDRTTRVMLIRVEVITPELEAADVAAAKLLADASTAPQGQAYFRALGRFAEPRFRRASSLLGDPAYGASFLATIATAATAASLGE
jgi:hypothetical protein